MKGQIFIFLLFLACTAYGQICDKPIVNGQVLQEAAARYKAPLSFIENIGQITDQFGNVRSDIRFKVSTAKGLNIFVGESALHYQFFKPENNDTKGATSPQPFNGSRIDVELVGANKKATVVTEQALPYQQHFHTADSSLSSASANSFAKVVYKEVYPKIDWVLLSNNNHLEYEFLVHEGGNIADIQIRYNGTDNLHLNLDGSITASNSMGAITELAPVSYNADGAAVTTKFKLIGNVLSYDVTNTKGALVIDPALEWATYLGGPEDESIGDITLDNAGNIYVVGGTKSASNIATTGAYQTTFGGSNDVFLAKFNSSGVPAWITYYGGAADDGSSSIMLDASGNLMIAGSTYSSSGIATPGARQTTLAGTEDAFVAKFSTAGSLLWATYFGGPGVDGGAKMALDRSGNIFMYGTTSSYTGIATTGAYQSTYGGSFFQGDNYLVKLNPLGTQLWGTYFTNFLGSTSVGGKAISDIAVDSIGNVFITGATQDIYLYTPGAFDTVRSGGSDVYLAKFSTTGAIQFCTYFGGTSDDVSNAMAIDNQGNVYLAGPTLSTDSLATPGTYQTSPGGFYYADAFLAKFSNNGIRQWATYFGGPTTDFAFGLSASGSKLYLSGITNSYSNIASLGGAYITSYQGSEDGFLAEFTTAGALNWSTYVGAAGYECGRSVKSDNVGNIYQVLQMSDTAGVATPGAYQTRFGGGVEDGFIAKFKPCPLPQVGAISGPSTVCVGDSITLINTIAGGIWLSRDTNKVTVSPTGVVRGIAAGTGNIVYRVFDACGIRDTMTAITINPVPTVTISASQTTVCPSTAVVFTATAINGGSGASYQWKKNNINVGTNSPVYRDSSLNNNDSVQVLITSSIACPPSAQATSNTVGITISQAPGNVSMTDTSSGCAGNSFLQLSIQNGSNTALQIQWLRNGIPVDTTDFPNLTVAKNSNPSVQQATNLQGIALRDSGNIVFINNVSSKLFKWHEGDSSGQAIAGLYSGSTANLLYYPTDLFYDDSGYLYISDTWNSRIQKWPRNCSVYDQGITIAGGLTRGSGASQFSYPAGIVQDSAGNIYVADFGNNRVQRWARGASAGVTVAGGNGLGSNANQLNGPQDVSLDRNGNLYVMDTHNQRVQKWAPGATAGVTVAGGNGRGSAANQLNGAYSLSVDKNNNVYVADVANHRIQMWAPGATSGITVAGGNGAGAAQNQIYNPSAITLDTLGNIYISDESNNRIQKWPINARIDTTYTPSVNGTYTAIVIAASGCSSISNPVTIGTVTAAVTISVSQGNLCQGSVGTFTATAINGGSTAVFQWKKNGQNVGGNAAVYTDSVFGNNDSVWVELTSSNACAINPVSISNKIKLTISPRILTTDTQTICAGQVYASHGASGTYTDTFHTTTCDSIRTLYLTVQQPVSSTDTQTICAGQVYASHGTSGTYTDTFHTTTCDSIRTLYLTVLPPVTDSVYPIIVQGQQYNGHAASGVYIDTIVSASSCDTIQTVFLSVINNDTIWPGDANADGIANNVDLLNIGIAYGDTGIIRPLASINWNAQYCPQWIDTFANGLNANHADCDGNGIVDANDTLAVTQNYGLTHQKTENAASTGPRLYLNKAQLNDTLLAGTTVHIPVLLGSPGLPISSIYGLAFSIHYDTTLVESNSVRFAAPVSWMGVQNNNLLAFHKNLIGNAVVDVALVRTNHANIGGNGQIATLGITIKPGTSGMLPISINNVTAIKYDGTPVALDYSYIDTFYISTATGISEHGAPFAIKVTPNPTHSQLQVIMPTTPINDVRLQVSSTTGSIILSENIVGQVHTINTSAWAAGIYILKVNDANGNSVITKVVKQ